MKALIKLWEKIKEVVAKMFGKKDIYEVLNLSANVSSEMQDAITLWGNMYCDAPPWLHEPTYKDPTKIASLGLPAFIASEKARMATLEMKSVITSGKNTSVEEDNTRAGYLNSQYKKLLNAIRKQLEYGIALGGLIIKPYIYKDKEIEFNYVTANNFFPISFDSTGKITCGAFADSTVENGCEYVRFEIHSLDIATSTITVINRVFKMPKNDSNNTERKNAIGAEVPLSEVTKWADLEPVTVIQNVDRLLFSYFRMPEANTIDINSPLGTSGYSRAVSLIKEADMQYSRLIWEFEGGQMAVDIDRDALRTTTDPDGNLIEVSNNLQRRLFRKIDLNAEDTYQVFNPNLRDVSYVNGLNTIFMRIEDVCGISRGVISDITRSEAKTATEMLILKQRSYATNADIQKALQTSLEDVVYVMDVLCSLYNLAPDGEYHVSYEWDDSLITSPDEELARRMTLVNAGIESKLAVRMWYYGETQEQARAAMSEAETEAQKSAELEALATGLTGVTAQSSNKE